MAAVTIDRPAVPPAYRPPAPPPPTEPRPVPPRLARLARRHPLVIAAVLVTISVTLATVAATVVAFGARWWWVFDILTSYRPQFVLILALAAVALAVLRCWKTLVVAVLALALNAVLVAPVITGHQAAARPGSPTLTLAHLNLQSRVGDLPGLDRWLTTRPADIIVLLHTTVPTARHLDHGDGRYRMIYPRVIPDPANYGGVRFDPRGPEVIVLTDRTGVTAAAPTGAGLPSAAVQVTAHLGSQRITLLALHTLSPGTGARQDVRDQELKAVTRWLEAAPRPAVAFGDFNTTYYSPELADLLHGAHATSSQVGFGIQATWPHQFRPAGIAIDQSVYTGDITAISRYRGPSLGSEHRSLVVTYALAAG